MFTWNEDVKSLPGPVGGLYVRFVLDNFFKWYLGLFIVDYREKKL